MNADRGVRGEESEGLAIRVFDLGKEYRIGGKIERYKTLRSTLMDAAGAPMRQLRARLERQGANGESGAGERSFWALKGVNFEVPRGQVVGVIGRNGAGKSTLLKILARITGPTEGGVDLCGRVGSLLEVGTGFHSELTGRENIYLSGAILGMRKQEIDRKLDEMVAFSGVETFLDTAFKHYSSGMQMRLAFAVAAHLEPEILLVDEVLAVGDLAFQNKCLDKMRDISGSGRTVLFVSHNLGAIHQLCERCILLERGRVLADGPTESVIKTYVSEGLAEQSEYRQAHDGRKAMNLRRAYLSKANGELCGEFRYDERIEIHIEYEVNEPIEGGVVWLSIRTAEEEAVFTSSDCDADGALLSRREPGRYETVLAMDDQWLNAGKYLVVVGIARTVPTLNFDRVEALSFSVLDVNTPSRMRFGTPRPGILHPLLEWTTVKQSAAE